jgi:LEA14-like dessication related protein
MRKQYIIAIVGSLWLLSSCKIYPPVYQRVEHFRFDKIGPEGLSMGTEAVFYNPNKMKFKLHAMQMNVAVDGHKLGSIDDHTEVTIAKNSEFRIPINIHVKPDISLGESLKTIWQMVVTKEIDVQLNGTVTIKSIGIKIPIPISETQKVNLDQIKLK